jgi:hypothetical protein
VSELYNWQLVTDQLLLHSSLFFEIRYNHNNVSTQTSLSRRREQRRVARELVLPKICCEQEVFLEIMTVIQVVNACKSFTSKLESKVVLNGFDMTVHQGSM